MSAARIAAYCSAIVLLCLLGATVYAYLNLGSLVERVARHYLQDYGVQAFDLEGLELAPGHLRIDAFNMVGEQNGLTYRARVSLLQLNYSWRMLYGSGLPSLSLDRLDVLADKTGGNPGTAPDSIIVEELLPQNSLSGLPLQALTVNQWRLDYHTPGMAPLSLSGRFTLENHQGLELNATHQDSHLTARVQLGEIESPLVAQVSLRDGDLDITQVTLAMARSADEKWQWEIEGALQYTPALNWLRQLALQANLPLEDFGLEKLALRGDSEFKIQVHHPDTLSLSPADGLSPLSQVEATVVTGNRIEQLDLPPMLADFSGEGNVSFNLKDGAIKLVAAPLQLAGSLHADVLQLPAPTRRWLLLDEWIPIRLSSPGESTLRVGNDLALALQLRNTLLVLGGGSTELRAGSLDLDAQIPGDLSGSLRTTISARLDARLRKQGLPQLKLKLEQHGSLEQSEFSLGLHDTAESMNLDLDGTLNLQTGSGRYTLVAGSRDLPYASRTVLPLLRKFDVLQQAINVSSGTASLSSKLKSGSYDIADVQQESSLQIEKLSGSFEDYRFEGIAVDSQWSGIKQWKTLRPIEFTMARLEVGFAVTDLRTRVSLPQPTPVAQPMVRIEQFSAGMFGGRAYLPQARAWNFASESNSMTLKAEKWQLADIVALQQNQDIHAQGELEGELPVEVTAGRLIIGKGYLRATSGGSIRYIANEAGAALAESSEELGLALDLLNDFKYEILNSEVELDREGNLLLALSLSGKNPAYYEGREVQFNINLEQNLDPLLQSLRLSDKLVESLENKLR